MLISKEVEIQLNPNNINYYEELGYCIPRRIDNRGRNAVSKGTKILVKVEDLPDGSNVKVICQCDKCGETKHIEWLNYILTYKKYDKYYCCNCIHSLYGSNNSNITKLGKSLSFEEWCVENDSQDVLNRWDYSFNKAIPSKVLYSSNKRFYFKCLRGLHESELKHINHFTGGETNSLDCKYCNSFAQWGIDNLGEDFLEKYWDYEKNNKLKINPWNISKGSNKRIFIICQEKDYHGSYSITNTRFVNGSRCSYCSSKNTHKLDSLGTLYPQVLIIWSNKNKISPYEYNPFAHTEVYWKCLDNKHEDFKRKISYSTNLKFRCPDCVRERNESFLQEKVRLYLESLNYTIFHEHNCTIIPKNPKTKQKMPFDNEIKELKLIIEIHGIQHYQISGFHLKAAKRSNTTPKYQLHMQIVRDRYKRIVAKKQGYSYLEIPYWADDKEEIWKQMIDEKIEEILDISSTPLLSAK